MLNNRTGGRGGNNEYRGVVFVVLGVEPPRPPGTIIERLWVFPFERNAFLPLSYRFIGRIFGQAFGQIFGQGFDQGLGEGKKS